MLPNNDYVTETDFKKIMKIYFKENIKLYEIGKLCEVKDKGFWSRILHGKKPVPKHVRDAMKKLFQEYGV